MKKIWIVLTGIIICLNCGCQPTATAPRPVKSYSYIDLVNQLTDLERLAVLPEEGEKTVQWSSYDRNSKYDTSSGKYVGWSANGDGTGYIRKEGDKLVIAEMDGPGVIWRIWSARAENGHVKIYLDGAKEPIVNMPFIGYFNYENEPFTRTSLIYQSARGYNSYIPIPYQKSCKITAEEGWGRYYHFTYTTYPKDIKLPTFSLNLTDAESTALDKADAKLKECGLNPAGKHKGGKVERKTITIPAGKTATIAQLNGQRAITAIKAQMSSPIPPNDRDTLRELVFSIHWDGESEPSVWSPLGDFFGTGPGFNKYKSLPMGMTEKEFYSYWYMPFEKNAVLKLQNKGRKTQKVTFAIHHAPIQKPIKQLGRFHAKWHWDAFEPLEEERWPDWTMLTTQGKGRFCGVMLNIWNPKGGWWGEGDEKFFIDGEKFPSTIGTGSEDYFGYAWGCPEFFEKAYHCQTFNEKGNKGHISLNRWHIVDNIGFQKSFEGCIEKYFPNEKPTIYNCIAYWYLCPNGKDPYRPTPTKKVEAPLAYSETAEYKGAVIESIFIDKATLELSTKTKGTKIYYTLDGSEPTSESKQYTNTIIVTNTTELKAKAYKENYLPSPVSTIKLRKTSYLKPMNPKNVVNGLNYRVYKGEWQNLPDFSKLEPVETGTVKKLDHSKIADKDFIGLEFTGYINIPQKGFYAFYVASDDGSKLYINDVEVVDHDGRHAKNEKSGLVPLIAGMHPIKVLFFEATGFEALRVSYKGPGIKKQVIPNDKFFIESP
ncbi:MAG: DUF2961 domain-containing protein [Planctomycetota bacterium]|jgi:hypothetical protein